MKKFLLTCFVVSLTIAFAMAQDREVSGRVTAADDGSVLPGVNVVLKGTTIGAVTDSDGRYKLSVPTSGSVLIFSFIGYTNMEVEIASRSVIDVQLETDITQLSEVIVVGYGTQIKQDLTGNIAQVKGDDIKGVPVPNLTQALQGRAAGVFIESQSGRVGEGIKVRIRGTASLSASSEPLYVVDGIPINASTLTNGQTGTAANTGSALASINFNDIESFEILKDASAAAIYGARASNGVVLITTKKGKAGKTSFNLNMQYGTSSPTNKSRGFLNSKEYVELFTEAAERAGSYEYNRLGNPYGWATEQESIDDWVSFVEGRFNRYSGFNDDWQTQKVNTNWENLAYQKNPLTKIINLNASGGTDKTKFFVSGEYNSQDGILIANDFERFSTRVNLEQEATKFFKFGINLSFAKTITHRLTSDNDFGTPMQIVALAPITPVRDADGQLNDRPVTTYYNPLLNLENGHYESTLYRNLGGIYGVFNLAKDLAFRTELGFDLLTQNDDQFFGSKTQSASTNGFGQSDWLRTFNYNTNNYFSYSKTFGSHVIDATLGMSFQKAVTDQTNVTGIEFPTDDLKKLASAGKINGGFSTATQYSFLSYFARANYKLNDRYLLSLSGRVDGSSRFGTSTRYGFFPAASAGWVISNEGFLKNNAIMSFLKFRASYGVIGNAEIGDFNQLGLWQAGIYSAQSTLNPSQLANTKLGWEKTKQTDIGLDFGFWNNRFSGEIDYYIKDTDNLLYFAPVPGTSGFNSRLTNIGAIQNKGFEIVLNSTNIDKGGLRWTTSFNLARNSNKVTKLDGDQKEVLGNDGRYLNSLIIGQPIGVFYGPKFAGVDPANGDALYYMEDGETTTNDYNDAGNFVVGNPNPKFIYGLSNNVSYKGFDLTILFQGVSGNDIINGAGGFMSANANWFDNQTKDQLKRWQQPGDKTRVPELRLGYDNWLNASSRYVYDGSYLRLKTITFGYNLPGDLVNKAKLSSVRVYLTGQNLLTFTDYVGWDPELNADYRASNVNQGGDFYSAPQAKSYVFGLNIGF
jgi:TonB-linked SusC/RagA family outer membrane protein